MKRGSIIAGGSASRREVTGFSLIEMLISIIVLTMGLLSVAGLTAKSLAANDSSGYRASAGQLAMRISDAMRANRNAAFLGDYNMAIGASAPSLSAKARDDLTTWKAALATLPEGDGSVDFSAVTRQATIIVRWNDQRAGGSTVSEFTYAFRP